MRLHVDQEADALYLRLNEIVAALADQAYLAYIVSGGKTDQILKQLRKWQVLIL